MVSIQKLAPAPQAGRQFVSTKQLKGYAAVLIEFRNVIRNTPGYKGRNSHKAYGTFTFFNSEGREVGKIGPEAEWEVSVNQKGNSLLDRFPSNEGDTVLVHFSERQGTGEFAGSTFNEVGDLETIDPNLFAKIIEYLDGRDAPAGPPALD